MPDKTRGRLVTFLSLAAITLFHCMSRCLTTVLIYILSGKGMLLMLLGVEFLALFVYKLVRGDLHYWPPVTGVTSYVGSFVARIIVKVMVDFTACAHFRHPLEYGGALFALSTVYERASEASEAKRTVHER